MKKNFFKTAAILLPVFIILSVYILTPSSIVLTKNARYSAYPNGFVRLEFDTVDTSQTGTAHTRARLFGALPIKTVRVSVIPEHAVCVSGEAIGVRLYSDGIMVIEVESNGAAHNAGLHSGDIITHIDKAAAQTVEQLSAAIERGSPVCLTVKRGNLSRDVSLSGREDERGCKVGMWVRDSAAGIGTMTFSDPSTGKFGALGHPICDSDTGKIISVRSGNISDCTVYSVKKGLAGDPGELIGSIGKNICGEVLTNDELGLYGVLSQPQKENILPCATRYLVKEGAAEIYCDIGSGTEVFSCEIEEVSKLRTRGSKSMVLKITDERLLSATGGIVQGMSGAPIVQNGRLVGAVTHVCVNL